MRKIPGLMVVGLCLLIPAVAWSGLVDSATSLEQAEQLYRKGQFSQAEQLCRTVLSDSDEEVAFKVRSKLPIICLAANRQAEAKTATSELLSKHADREFLPHALHEIIEEAKNLQKVELAGQMCQGILAAQPEHLQRLWLEMGVALANVYQGKDQAVEANVKDLIGRHSNNQWAAETLAQIGWAYDKLRQYNKAKPLYEYAVDNWSEKPRAIHAHTALVRDCILLGDDGAARARLEQLVQRYARDSSLPGVLSQIGRDYRQARKYEQSRQVSQYILDNHPNDGHCLWAQRDIVLCDLAMGDHETARVGTQTLLAKYANHSGAIWAVSEVAEAYSKLGRHEEARELFKFNLDHYPERDDNIWSLRSQISESIALKDSGGIEAGIKRLLEDYAGSKNLPMAALHVGRGLLEAGHARAAELFQYVLDKHPDHEQAIFAKVCLGHAQIRLGEEEKAEAIFRTIVTRYAGDVRLAQAVHMMAEGYFDQAVLMERETAERIGSAEYARVIREQGRSKEVKHLYQRAIEKWQIIIKDLPFLEDVTPGAWYFTGVTYRRHLGEEEKAIPYYEKVVQTWPGYEYAWSAQAMLPVCYENMMRAGRMTPERAEAMMEKAYQVVVDRYPTCSLAEPAYLRLGLLKLKKDQPEQAAAYFTTFLDRYPNARQWPHALVYLATTYERRGRPETAAELYRSYLDLADPEDPRIKLIRAKLEKAEERTVEE